MTPITGGKISAGGFTHPWAGQARCSACRERPPNASCGQKPASTRGRRAGRLREGPCRGRVDPVCRFQEGGKTTGVADFGGVFSTCERYFLKSRQSACSHKNSAEDVSGGRISDPLGTFDFHTGIISAALGTFPGSTSKILIHSSSTKKDSPPEQNTPEGFMVIIYIWLCAEVGLFCCGIIADLANVITAF